MNYRIASMITDTWCVRWQLIGNEFTRGLSDRNRIHKAQTDSPRGVPRRRRDILFCLTHVIRTRAHGGRHRCRCTVERCASSGRVYRDLSRKATLCWPRSRQLQSLCLAWPGRHVGVDRFPALDANAEITPCDPLDRLSGV